MTEDNLPGVSSSESDSSTAKRRKRRKWDQPDESLVPAATFPVASMGLLSSVAPSTSGAPVSIPFYPAIVAPVQAVVIPLQQHATSIVQKLLQPKMQDELIAREIVINDADSAIRYKLTKRQTQEEIQISTGAVVITRGKYRPPNAPPDGERPLYLHISAASHMETTAERIKAVDQAAAMVEDMLKQVSASNGVKADYLLSTCVFLGFEADPSLDIVSRIRGPNDQYVNHIMNETGATVLLRGRGSGYSVDGQLGESQQSLHLYLSSNDAKKLECAKLLAENLLDTISADCGEPRVSSSKVYGAVPPPPQLQAGVQIPGNVLKVHDTDAICSTVPATLSDVASPGGLTQSMGIPKCGLTVANTSHPPFALTSSTSYSGYGGIYPQATPLQQVALALKQSTSPLTAIVAPVSIATEDRTDEVTRTAVENRPKRRKFHELPAVGSPTILHQKNVQGLNFPAPPESASNVVTRDVSAAVQTQEKHKKLSSNGIPASPRRRSFLPAPSPPQKFSSSTKSSTDGMQRLEPKSVPDTLIKLMEYGDDDDEDDGETTE